MKVPKAISSAWVHGPSALLLGVRYAERGLANG